MSDMNEKAIEAAANAFAAVFRERPVQVAHNPDLAGSFFPHIKAALSALPPLRAREEIETLRRVLNLLVNDGDPPSLVNIEGIEPADVVEVYELVSAALSRTAGQEWRDMSVLQDDLGEMLRALGLPDGARPQSPHAVFRECIEAVKALKTREPQSSAEYHQRRGAAWDIIDEALIAYREFMLDDDYDAVTALKKICDRMEERRALYLPASPVTEPIVAEKSEVKS